MGKLATALGVPVTDLDPNMERDPLKRLGSGLHREPIGRTSARLIVNLVVPNEVADEVLEILSEHDRK
jgi:hypothetical protein